ncbi:MAG: DNA topoisomerase IB [Chthoniobacteraceae bacterium]
MKSFSLPAPAVARDAGLHYVSDARPGITRQSRGKKGFAYRAPGGSAVRDPETLRRIRGLAIPPAWTKVWICPSANGHLQAVGRDARGRKQYRYHPRWREVRDESKYSRVLAFGERLPRIRRRVAADLRRRGLSREKVLATVVKLLETTLIRVGNDEYAQQNGSYGLTTLHNRHATVRGSQITFEFKGKSGKPHRIDVRDPRLAKLVRRCQELPGQDLFGYVEEDGTVRDVTSEEVNAYLREIAGAEFSAKDFRTWAGTILAAIALREFEEFGSQREAKRNVVQAVEAVAKMLGNTAAVCRRCYIHPAILDGYLSGQTIATLQQSSEQRLRGSLAKLKAEEAAVMMLLHERLASAERSGGAQRASSLTRNRHARRRD